jgi:hypothetical protein
VIFSSLTDLFYILGQLFSVLASENAGLLASLATVLKILIHTPDIQSNLSSVVTQGTKNEWPFTTDGDLGQIVLIGNVLRKDKNRVAA